MCKAILTNIVLANTASARAIEGGCLSKQKRTEITIETDQLLIIRRRHSTRLWCHECGRDADFVPWERMERAGVLLEKGAKAPEPRPGGGLHGFHTHATRDETILVCVESVLVFLTKSD